MNRILIEVPEVIETERLKLQMPKAGFGPAVHEAIVDGYDDYIKWLCWPSSPPSLEAVEEDCRKHHAEFILRDWIRYLITDKETGQVLGRIGYPPFQSNWSVPQFGISYFIRKSQRGKGSAIEATHAMALLAFRILNAKKVEIVCDDENVASNAIPKRLNFQLEYTQRGGWPRPDGQLAKLNTYACFSAAELPEKFVKWD
jgi:RimJ/RimL family protein N-acetyltransferase